MARPRSDQPAYRYHISGQACVTLAGKDFYLGPHNSPESRGRYFALLAEYNANGKQAPEATAQQADNPVTVRCVTGEFREHAKSKYANDPKELNRFNNLCTTLEDEHGDDPADSFGPRKLAEVRALFVANGDCRKYVNRQTNNVVKIFRHAVSCELIGPDRIVALQSLEPLRAGQTKAPESKRIEPVALEDVRATAEHLSPTVKAMVRLQVSTGMRPSEVCRMRPADIDQSGPEWIYRPASHKTSHRGKVKAVPILGDARAALVPFMDRDPEAHCFSPAESAQWHRDQRTANRITPHRPGRNAVGTNRKANPKSGPGAAYKPQGYRQAIQRAAKKAKVSRWFPYQMRHLAATAVRDALGVESAQSLLGHSRASMTEHYAKQSEAKAIEAAKYAPKI